jgi:hypothetical protein
MSLVQEKGASENKKLLDNLDFLTNAHCKNNTFKRVCLDFDCSIVSSDSYVKLSIDKQELIIDRSKILSKTIYYLEVETIGVEDAYIVPVQIEVLEDFKPPVVLPGIKGNET